MLQQIYNTINVIVAASASHSISTTRSPGRRPDVEWRCVDEKKTQQQSEFIFYCVVVIRYRCSRQCNNFLSPGHHFPNYSSINIDIDIGIDGE